ncbi:DUF2147 domain-containing protein [Sphingobium estronivorans]|uniref:DUF2147 domain-containing protein n=1 Tax=Sphingobium estronivorans TaxID=1577690 RepID=UPI00123ACFEA|nr:DUF2147 domain-containing protein [Sphingobium estronivorans]
MPAFSIVLLIAAGAAPQGVEGNWLTDDRKGVVQIAPCGQQMCGRIVQVLDKGPNVPATDINNPDPKRRSQPIVGLLTLWGFQRDGATWKGGRAYDPKTGRSYRATLGLNPDGSLKVTGCVLFVCEGRRWTRTR